MATEVSHGRGGAGNFNADDTQYVDGEIVRSGAEGSHGDGAFSTGRGGAANIADADTKATKARADHDVVPEAATRPSQDVDYHTGRGGAGNEHHATPKPALSDTPRSLADRLKDKLFGRFSSKK